MVRAEILEQIFNRVVTKATTPVNHYMGMNLDKQSKKNNSKT